MRFSEVVPAPVREKFRALGRNFRIIRSVLARAELGARANSLAFTTLLSIAPLLAVLFWIFKKFGVFDIAYERLQPFLLENLSEGAGSFVTQHLLEFVEHVHTKALGWAGLAGLSFTGVMAYLSVARAFQVIWGAKKARALWDRVFRGVLLMLFAPVLVIASIALTTAISAHLKDIPFSGHFYAFFLNLVLYSLVYKLAPPVNVPMNIVLRGAVLPAALWEFAKSGYAIYTKKVVTLSAFYGSLAAIPIFLLWVYIAWYITLFGAAWIRSLQEISEEAK